MINATIKNELIKELNSAQKDAVERPINSAVKVVAGAGSGKTKIISKRFIKLTFDLIDKLSNPAEHILVITFTDKASAEMKERILKELDNFNISQNNDSLWISTFHSFCNTILKRHSLEIGMNTNATLADDKTRRAIFDIIINKIRYNELSSIQNLKEIEKSLDISTSILDIKKLNKLKNISTLDNLFEDIWECIKKIKAQGLSPKEFLNKTLLATETYSKTVCNLQFGFKTKEEYENSWHNTLRDYFADDYSIDEIFQNTQNLKSILLKNGAKKPEKWTPAPKFPEFIEPAQKLEKQLTQTIAFIYAIYQNELKHANLLDFDDLINKTIELFKTTPSIRSYYQQFFRHIIVDEFQDTNGAQLELIKLLLDENDPNITFVGDRKQSIYGFRFAQMENLDILENFIKEKYGKTYPEIKLKINYRSTQNVLETVNYLTTEHLGLDETLEFFHPNPAKNLVKTAIFENNLSASEQKDFEANYIASEILKLKNNQNKYSDFAILVKSHQEASLIQKALEKAKIPATKKVNTGFFESAWIKNIIAMLRFIKNSTDEQALIRLLKLGLSFKELYNLKQSLKNDFPAEEKLNIAQILSECYEKGTINNPYTKKLFDIKKELNSKKNLSLLQIYQYLIEQLPVYNTFELQVQNDLIVFEKIIIDFMENNYITIPRFLDYIEKIKDDRNFTLPKIDDNIDAVQLLTIHASKGLEFPYVFVSSISSSLKTDKSCFIFDLQYGNKQGFGIIINKINEKSNPKSFLYKEIWLKPRERKENLRLYYVALSRAEKYLNILNFRGIKGAEYTKNYPDFVKKEYIGEYNEKT